MLGDGATILVFSIPDSNFRGKGGDGEKAWEILGDCLGTEKFFILFYFEVLSPKFPTKILGL